MEASWHMCGDRSFAAAFALAAAALLIASCSGEGPGSASRIREPAAEPASVPVDQNQNETASKGAGPTTVDSGGPETPADPDERHREAIVGLWKQVQTGVRWLDVRPDGTATMFIDPDWIAKAVIGNSLTVEIEWSIEEGRVFMRSVSGEPKSAFQAVTTLYGSDRERPIVTLDDSKLVMLDEEEGEESAWVRVGSSETVPAVFRN